MLYMVINTHAAERCAFRGQDEAQHLETAFDRLPREAEARGVRIDSVLGSEVLA